MQGNLHARISQRGAKRDSFPRLYLISIGGGVLITHTLVFLFKFSQQQAQGTTLALLIPPIGLLAALTYYQQGFVNLKAALLICLGFV
ncbi:sulfite exporter TauE/SafE family protein [Crocosphaera chwakensis]|uniref:EamA domain-containing protein n=1 Tax=Crocosphaera chwakensis CCY0110 TaxID=391612 RepID=A3IWU5_9CHRO|nr:sulfite exporter TauE/SafE family protein [Crocosphaera chwakensis]EAZ89047.1 hypothetical protein CY0110_01350 [Crocosphaera chwakensis CCY0110]